MGINIICIIYTDKFDLKQAQLKLAKIFIVIVAKAYSANILAICALTSATLN